jgi:hypothetical protein
MNLMSFVRECVEERCGAVGPERVRDGYSDDDPPILLGA